MNERARTEYLEHIAERRPSMGAHLATFALASAIAGFSKYVPIGEQNIPEDGPVILAANHISYADTVILNAYFYLFQRVPGIMAKEELFKPPVVGNYMRAIHALPVARGQGPVNQPMFDAAESVLDRGDALMIYPEGGAGRGEDFWPIRGKSGLGHLALKTGAPVVPVAQWGAQEFVWRGDDGKQHLSLWPPRKPIALSIGEPLVFNRDAFEDKLYDGRRLVPEQQVTDFVMHSITQQLGEIRGEEPQGYYAKPLSEVAPGLAREQ